MENLKKSGLFASVALIEMSLTYITIPHNTYEQIKCFQHCFQIRRGLAEIPGIHLAGGISIKVEAAKMCAYLEGRNFFNTRLSTFR